jgi:hypothetical protein
MNFFGHAWLASQRRAESAFVFGAMLPDLAAMVGLRVEHVAHAVTADGRRFHLATDAAFHRSGRFGALVASTTRTLREAGLRPGPARAIGHVGVELLFDGWLAERHGVPDLYDAALVLGPALLGAVTFRSRADAAPLGTLCTRIRGASLPPEAWCEPERLAARLARILAARPRLALEARELPAVRGWAERARVGIAREAPALFDGVRRELAALG